MGELGGRQRPERGSFPWGRLVLAFGLSQDGGWAWGYHQV